MSLCISSIVILFVSFIGSIEALNASSSNLTAGCNLTNLSVGPPLTEFIDQTELVRLEKSVPQELVEWINATIDEPWASYQQSQEEPRRARGLGKEVSRRYTDVTRCVDSRRRLILRNEMRAVTQMILDAQNNLNLNHPIWLALISPAFREEPRALERMKGLFKTLFDLIIDSKYTVALSCNFAKPQCLQTRKAPSTGTQQVPAAYFNLNENVVNLCKGFFGLPQLGDMKCREGTPMSSYMAMSSSLLHEMIHGIFEPLAQTNFDFITFDLAYGFGACADLAKGKCKPSDTGIRCSPLATIANVDTIMWLVYGYYWYNECSKQGKKIPLY